MSSLKGGVARTMFVISQRVRLGGVVSGLLTAGGLLTAAILAVSSPWWMFPMLGDAFGSNAIFPIGLAALIMLALPLAIAALASDRPGNVAMRRRLLAMDGEGIRFYTSRWWQRPFRIGWDEFVRITAYTEIPGGSSRRGPKPTFVPWDNLAFQWGPEGTRGTQLHALWLTANVEQIVAKVHEHRSDLPFVDDRLPAADGFFGQILARRRR